MRASLALAQQLSSVANPPRVLVFTCGSLAANGTQACSGVSHGGVWGFARVLRLEHAALRALSVDVSHGATIAALHDAAASTMETEVAWRSELCCAARLRACITEPKGNRAFLRGSYAITGGLGGLGLRAAALLIEGGSTGVLLASRSGRVLRDGQGLNARLASLHAASQVMSSDVGDAADACCVLGHAALALGRVLVHQHRRRTLHPVGRRVLRG